MLALALIWLAGSMLWLGHQGMPRRYYAYLPEYLVGHRSAAMAALMVWVGLAVEAGLWVRGRGP